VLDRRTEVRSTRAAVRAKARPVFTSNATISPALSWTTSSVGPTGARTPVTRSSRSKLSVPPRTPGRIEWSGGKPARKLTAMRAEDSAEHIAIFPATVGVSSPPGPDAIDRSAPRTSPTVKSAQSTSQTPRAAPTRPGVPSGSPVSSRWTTAASSWTRRASNASTVPPTDIDTRDPATTPMQPAPDERPTSRQFPA